METFFKLAFYGYVVITQMIFNISFCIYFLDQLQVTEPFSYFFAILPSHSTFLYIPQYEKALTC